MICLSETGSMKEMTVALDLGHLCLKDYRAIPMRGIMQAKPRISSDRLHHPRCMEAIQDFPQDVAEENN